MWHNTDAVVDPGAVVVEDLDAVVADAAVAAAGRPVELTGHTPAVSTDHRVTAVLHTISFGR